MESIPLPQEPREPEQSSQKEPLLQQEDVADLEKGLHKRGFVEKHLRAFQTRKTKVPELSPEFDKNRGEVFRFERGQIFKAYRILRQQIEEGKKKGEDVSSKQALLEEVRERAKKMEEDLDELNRQYYESVHMVPVETKYGSFTIPVVELDLHKDDAEKKDPRPPVFLVGTIATTYHSTAALSMALALDGRRVFVATYPEQVKDRPENYKEILEKEGLGVHTELQKKIIEALGLEQVDLMGVSMGSAIAMDMATDKAFNRVHDLTVIEPVGIQKKSLARIAREFAINQGVVKAAPYAEAMIKQAKQGGDEGLGIDPGLMLADGKILAEKHFNPEKLKNLSHTGRCQVWYGTDSPLVSTKVAEELFSETDELRKEENPQAPSIELHRVKGGDHGWPFMNALGFSRLLGEEGPYKKIDEVDLQTLENSAMARMVRDLKHEQS